MSNQIDTSGPAFPLKEPLSNDSLGISVRDYFAAKALQGFIASITMLIVCCKKGVSRWIHSL